MHGIVKRTKPLDSTQALADTRCLRMLEPEYRSGATIIAEESVELDEPSVSSVGQWSARIESVIERYPWPTILLALGFGYLLARRLR